MEAVGGRERPAPFAGRGLGEPPSEVVPERRGHLAERAERHLRREHRRVAERRRPARRDLPPAGGRGAAPPPRGRPSACRCRKKTCRKEIRGSPPKASGCAFSHASISASVGGAETDSSPERNSSFCRRRWRMTVSSRSRPRAIASRVAISSLTYSSISPFSSSSDGGATRSSCSRRRGSGPGRGSRRSGSCPDPEAPPFHWNQRKSSPPRSRKWTSGSRRSFFMRRREPWSPQFGEYQMGEV